MNEDVLVEKERSVVISSFQGSDERRIIRTPNNLSVSVSLFFLYIFAHRGKIISKIKRIKLNNSE